MLRWNRTLAASVDEVEAFCLAVRRGLKDRGSASDVFAAELVLREVLANAVEHGARFDAGQTIAVDVSVTGGTLKARVSDQGRGFTAQPSPDDGERGRGLRILDRYAAAYAFEDGGRTVAFELPLHGLSEGSKE